MQCLLQKVTAGIFQKLLITLCKHPKNGLKMRTYMDECIGGGEVEGKKVWGGQEEAYTLDYSIQLLEQNMTKF